MCDTAFNIVGIFMALVRIREPHIWCEFKYQMFIFSEKLIRGVYRIKIFMLQTICCRRKMIHTKSYQIDVISSSK